MTKSSIYSLLIVCIFTKCFSIGHNTNNQSLIQTTLNKRKLCLHTALNIAEFIDINNNISYNSQKPLSKWVKKCYLNSDLDFGKIILLFFQHQFKFLFNNSNYLQTKYINHIEKLSKIFKFVPSSNIDKLWNLFQINHKENCIFIGFDTKTNLPFISFYLRDCESFGITLKIRSFTFDINHIISNSSNQKIQEIIIRDSIQVRTKNDILYSYNIKITCVEAFNFIDKILKNREYDSWIIENEYKKIVIYKELKRSLASILLLGFTKIFFCV